MRLARGVANLGRARRAGGGEQRGFGPGDRRLVKIDRCRTQAVRCGQRVATAFDAARPHRFQRFEMRVERAPRRKITARRRQVRASAAREQRAQQQYRAAQAADQRRVGLVLDDGGTPHAKRRAADALDLAAEVENQPRHHLDVADSGNVREDAFVGGEETRRQQRQRGVLVAFDVDGSGQALTAFDE